MMTFEEALETKKKLNQPNYFSITIVIFGLSQTSYNCLYIFLYVPKEEQKP